MRNTFISTFVILLGRNTQFKTEQNMAHVYIFYGNGCHVDIHFSGHK